MKHNLGNNSSLNRSFSAENEILSISGMFYLKKCMLHWSEKNYDDLNIFSSKNGIIFIVANVHVNISFLWSNATIFLISLNCELFLKVTKSLAKIDLSLYYRFFNWIRLWNMLGHFHDLFDWVVAVLYNWNEFAFWLHPNK